MAGYEKLDPRTLEKGIFKRHRLTDTGDTFSITELSRPSPREMPVKKLSASEYLYVPTGEIREFKEKAERRVDSIVSLRRTISKLRDIVSANVRADNFERVHWLTFTYRDRAVSGDEGARRVYSDWAAFWKRFVYYCGKRGLKKPEYISCLEAQGAPDYTWHLHVVLIWPHKRPYIANDVMAELWTHGFTKTKRLNARTVTGTNSLGNYLCAYLTDCEISELEGLDIRRGYEIKEREVEGKKKSYVKGARLALFGSYTRIYRLSAGIVRPQTHDITAYEMEKLQDGCNLMYQNAVRISDEAEGGFYLIVYKRVYRKKRRRSRAA